MRYLPLVWGVVLVDPDARRVEPAVAAVAVEHEAAAAHREAARAPHHLARFQRPRQRVHGVRAQLINPRTYMYVQDERTKKKWIQ